MIKLLDNINTAELLTCYLNLEKNIVWSHMGHSGKQSGLQYKDNEEPWSSATGRSKGKEISYLKINDLFSNTIFERIINDYKLKRTRLMWLNPKSCYSMHKDTTPRVHIPLITDPQCYFVFKDGIVEHLAIGYVYWIDTRINHTAINCSEQARLHLVGIVET